MKMEFMLCVFRLQLCHMRGSWERAQGIPSGALGDLQGVP